MRVRSGRCRFASVSRELRRDVVPPPLSPGAFPFRFGYAFSGDVTAAELADEDEICIGPAVLVFRTSAGRRKTETGTAA